MANQKQRGSEKIMAAWKTRVLHEDSIREIAGQFEKSPAKVEKAHVVGGASPTGMRVSLSYAGDDGDGCGNDILFWWKWHRIHGGVVKPPRILIDGIPFPDVLRVELDFGDVHPDVPPNQDLSTELEPGGLLA